MIEPLAKPEKRGPKPKKYIKARSKVANEWQRTRTAWFATHPVDYRDCYTCYLCGQAVHKSEVDLDHVLRKGSHPELRTSLDNLRPVHRTCHIRKDSGMKYERY